EHCAQPVESTGMPVGGSDARHHSPAANVLQRDRGDLGVPIRAEAHGAYLVGERWCFELDTFIHSFVLGELDQGSVFGATDSHARSYRAFTASGCCTCRASVSRPVRGGRASSAHARSPSRSRLPRVAAGTASCRSNRSTRSDRL